MPGWVPGSDGTPCRATKPRGWLGGSVERTPQAGQFWAPSWLMRNGHGAHDRLCSAKRLRSWLPGGRDSLHRLSVSYKIPYPGTWGPYCATNAQCPTWASSARDPAGPGLGGRLQESPQDALRRPPLYVWSSRALKARRPPAGLRRALVPLAIAGPSNVDDDLVRPCTDLNLSGTHAIIGRVEGFLIQG